MGVVSKPNTFSANTTITSSSVNDNFDTIYNEFNGSIAAANLATGAVTTAKIADSNVTTAKIADSNVTTAKIADSNVTTAKVAADAITDAKLAYGKVRARVGGDASAWGTAGTTSYDADSASVIVQTGVTTTSSGGTVSVTFPVAFSANPLIIGSQQGSVTTRAFASVDSSSNTGFTLSAISTANARAATTIAWIAIGIA